MLCVGRTKTLKMNGNAPEETMSNPNEMGGQAENADGEFDALALDKETLKDLEAPADASEAAKGGVGPISGILCFSRDCVSNGCATK